MKKTFVFIAMWFGLSPINAQAPYSKEVEAQIEKVENGLAGRIKNDGKTYNIFDRMLHYKVKGLSLAVVDNYKVVWAGIVNGLLEGTSTDFPSRINKSIDQAFTQSAYLRP